ncbi:hypothetical protein Tsubulata_039405 [Turnera subulata]|uniref:Uncharacterized protein n=1 Tax=Turnera subulata TaxID=218843 RepID=A0A9Q0G9A0_9ROSI|nr:hypothetical protein Tsubulata_039405 [Turnera subulata]
MGVWQSWGAWSFYVDPESRTWCSLQFTRRWILAASIVLPALGLTTAAVGSLVGYTFWAHKRGKDFGFLEPVLFPILTTLAAAGLLGVLSPTLDDLCHSWTLINSLNASEMINYENRNGGRGKEEQKQEEGLSLN